MCAPVIPGVRLLLGVIGNIKGKNSLMKMMVACLWLFFSMILCLAQGGKTEVTSPERPDLSGTWSLDFSASDFGVPKDEVPYDKLTLIISHNEPELRITRRVGKKAKERSQTVVYYSDGRGESNPLISGGPPVKSKTAWRGNILQVIGSTRGFVSGGGETMEMHVTDEWQLSPDGNTLTYSSSTVSTVSALGGKVVVGPIPQKIKRVFRRVRPSISGIERNLTTACSGRAISYVVMRDLPLAMACARR